MPDPPLLQGPDEPPREYAQATPRELYPTSDIRFVMIELGKLGTQVERLIQDVADFEKVVDARSAADCANSRASTAKIDSLEQSVSQLNAARSAPWWRKIDPANALLAAIGLVTLLLTLLLGNGRFEDIGKRIDAAEDRTKTTETRVDHIDEAINAKLDGIAVDVAALKAIKTSK